MAGLVGQTELLRVGIFGGTFDPPHIGHLILASEAQYQLNLDKVLWVLTPEPPHKRGREITPLKARLRLIIAALGKDPIFELSRVDIDRPPPHFAADTVSLLRLEYPNASLVYLMGSDSLNELPTWYSSQDFVERVDELGVMRRPGWEPDLAELEGILPNITRRVRYLDAPLIEISSSQVRAAIQDGRPFRYYLPRQVYQLIQNHALYRETS